MMRRFFLIVTTAAMAWNAQGQDDPFPRELQKRFERYARAWVKRDWNTIFELTAPNFQELLLQNSGSETREEWVKHQEVDVKDRITSLDLTATHRISETVFTVAITTKGMHPNGAEFSSKGYASFELMDGKWHLVDPVPPGPSTGARKEAPVRKEEPKPQKAEVKVRKGKEVKEKEKKEKVWIEPGF